MYSANNIRKIIMTLFVSFVFTTSAFAGSTVAVHKNIIYTQNPSDQSLQSLDIYSPTTGKNLPVVVFVHGGGWTTGDKKNRSHRVKKDFFVKNNIVFVSINYRMAPNYNFPAYPQDVATSTSFVINNIQRFGGNPRNIFMMGHSAGAHLAALVSTDDQYLKQNRKSLGNIRGVILLDGAAYDIPTVLNGNKKRRRQKMYEQAFSKDARIWKVASPINHIRAKKNIPPFLVFYVADRKQAVIQSTGFGRALNNAKVPTNIVPISNSSHKQINASFGLRMGLKEQTTLRFIHTNSTR